MGMDHLQVSFNEAIRFSLSITILYIPESQTGEYLEKFGLLDEAQTVIDTTHLFVL